MFDTSAENGEKLYLLEFLVDNVHFSESNNQGPESTRKSGGLCVRIEFLNYPPLEICEEDFCPINSQQSSDVKFKSGKSCLFSLSSCRQLPVPFDICVSVLRSTGQGNPKQVLGRAIVNIGGSFAALSNIPQVHPPVSRVIKDNFFLTDDHGADVGTIRLFIRLSAFGKAIVTQFQIGETSSSFLFKGDQTKGGGSFLVDQKAPPPRKDPCHCNNASFGNLGGGPGGAVGSPTYGGGFSSPAMHEQARGIGGGFSGAGFPGGGFSTGLPTGGMHPNMSGAPYPSGANQGFPGAYGSPGQYGPSPHTGGTDVSSNSSSSSLEESMPLLNLCDCDYPEPPGLRPLKKKKKKKKKKKPVCPFEMAAAQEGYCSNPSCPADLPRPPPPNKIFTLPPGLVGMTGNKLIFQNEPGTTNTNAVYKFNAEESGTQIMQVVRHPNEPLPVSDENKDVFVLRIGKKNPITQERNKLQLEFMTPRTKAEDNKNAKDSQTQYSASDFSSGATVKKSKVGVKKKGKGKKKK